MAPGCHSATESAPRHCPSTGPAHCCTPSTTLPWIRPPRPQGKHSQHPSHVGLPESVSSLLFTDSARLAPFCAPAACVTAPARSEHSRNDWNRPKIFLPNLSHVNGIECDEQHR